MISVNKGTFVLLLLLFMTAQFFGNAQIKNEQAMTTVNAVSASEDEAAIRALENRFAAAVNAGDIDAIMQNYIADKSLVVFDVVPRKEYLGADAYRKGWEDFFSRFKGSPKLTIIDLRITVDGSVAFSHSFMNTTGTDMQGRAVDRTVRVSAGYRKINGNWLIVHEHISVPVDLATGKAVPVTKP
jgi:uncharacterized protein (TIGR02246 family)